MHISLEAVIPAAAQNTTATDLDSLICSNVPSLEKSAKQGAVPAAKALPQSSSSLDRPVPSAMQPNSQALQSGSKSQSSTSSLQQSSTGSLQQSSKISDVTRDCHIFKKPFGTVQRSHSASNKLKTTSTSPTATLTAPTVTSTASTAAKSVTDPQTVPTVPEPVKSVHQSGGGKNLLQSSDASMPLSVFFSRLNPSTSSGKLNTAFKNACLVLHSGGSHTQHSNSESIGWFSIRMIGDHSYRKSPDHSKTEPRWQLFGWIWNSQAVWFWNAIEIRTIQPSQQLLTI